MTAERAEPAPGWWTVKEQTIYDGVSGLIIQFSVDSDGFPRLRVFGKIPFGNREIGFGPDGLKEFSGTALEGSCGLPENPD